MARVRTEDKTEDILEAALRRFLHYGLRKTSMQEVASDAGVGVGTLYLYFKSKDDLVVGCAERFAVQHREQAAELLSSRRRADRKLVEYVRHRWAVWQEVGLRAPHAEELSHAILRLRPDKAVQGMQDFVHHLVALLREGKETGVFPHVRPARDARVLGLSLSVFFPLAGREHPMQPGERELLLVLGWFVARFKSRERRRPVRPARAERERD